MPALWMALCLAASQPAPADLAPPARPDVLGPFNGQAAIATTEAWETERKPALRQAFQDLIYGYLPTAAGVEVLEERVISPHELPGADAASEIIFKVGSVNRKFAVAYALPPGDGPFPVVMQLSFCGNRAAFGGAEAIAEPFSGTPEFCSRFAGLPPSDEPDPYLFALPVERLMAAGIAVASVYAGDVVPDNKETAIPILKELSGSDDPEKRLGAIAAWGWVAATAMTEMAKDERIDGDRLAVMGHSRNGKAAVTGAMFSEDIDILWAHQSGTGGATLNRSYEGEAVENITGGFPHWFAPAYRGFAGAEDELPIDQHQALALVAPRRVLLGGGYDDLWAGPVGAYRAAQGADAVWGLYGSEGLDQPDTDHPNLNADLAVFIREGRHGTTRSDWEKFITFMTQGD